MEIIYKETFNQNDCFENFENMYIYFKDSDIKNCLNSFKIDISSGESIQKDFEELEKVFSNSKYKSLVVENFETSHILQSYISCCLEYLKDIS